MINLQFKVSKMFKKSFLVFKRSLFWSSKHGIKPPILFVRNFSITSLLSKKSRIIDSDEEEEQDDLEIIHDAEYEAMTSDLLKRSTTFGSNCFVIQPYVKWGPSKSAESPELKLAEAVALVNSIPEWNVVHKMTVPLETLEKHTLFGKGKMQELQELIKRFQKQHDKVSTIFISTGTLKYVQKKYLETMFKMPVLDRYSIVLQILRLHAVSKEAMLQVAMAELPYVWSHVKDIDPNDFVGDLTDLHHRLNGRESKLNRALLKVRRHRHLLRKKRLQLNFPTVAVVGYTNAGKTCLIKALTGSDSLTPKDKLFATLDITAHAGVLPGNLKVIYMDTIGFISDIPTNLLECFQATLEDAMIADVIVHVQDWSHPARNFQKVHVENTLEKLLLHNPESEKLLSNMITVANKIDLCPEDKDSIDNQILPISAKRLIGLEELKEKIQKKLLEVTRRMRLNIRVPMGGQESSWLYKNVAVTDTYADPNDNQYLIMNVIITELQFTKFKNIFVKRSAKL